jgi:formylglycine-generating enzyme required for sulfatase activity
MRTIIIIIAIILCCLPLVGCGKSEITPTEASSSLIVIPTETEIPTVAPTITPTFTPPPPTPTPAPGIGSTLTGTDGTTMMFIPAGEFIMGGTQTLVGLIKDTFGNAEARLDWFKVNRDFSDSEPAHPINLNAFWIDQTEVSIAQYKKCIEAGQCAEVAPQTGHNYDTYMPKYNDPEYANHPVSFVNWEMANDYCTWAGRRLPTEAEWEKAARGTDERIFPWGNFQTQEQVSNLPLGCSDKISVSPYTAPGYPAPACDQPLYPDIEDTNEVDSYPLGASPYGVLNMGGNVSEWVSDWYSPTYYLSSPVDNPQGPDSGEVHVNRGPNFTSNANDGDLIITLRNFGSQEEKKNYWSSLGFRCASDYK